MKNIIIVCAIALLALACDPAEEESQKLTDFGVCATVLTRLYVLAETCNGYDTPEEALRILAEQDCEEMTCDNSVGVYDSAQVDVCVDAMKLGGETCEDITLGETCEAMTMDSCD